MQTEEILQAYAKRQSIRRYTLFGTAAASVLLLVVNLTPSLWGLMAGGVMLLVMISSAIHWRFWRCPACEKPLGREHYVHCPHCGTRLVA